MSLDKQIEENVKNVFDLMVTARREIHMHPEIGEDVVQTAKTVLKNIENLGLEVRTGVGKNGIVADLIIDPSYRTIALRADMDALPILEEGNASYKSKIDGCAHMCGHDSHTAMLIGAAHVIVKMKDKLHANVRFIFQPAEEILEGGASEMIAEGAVDGVDEIYGLHVWPLYDIGKVGFRNGPLMAKIDEFYVTIKGKGGHAAFPHETIDPVVVGANFVQAVQNIVARNLDPLESGVVSITQFNSGDGAINVIPPSVKIGASVRVLSIDTQKIIIEKVTAILDGMKVQYGIDYNLEYIEGYPVTFNHDNTADYARKICNGVFGEENVDFPCNPVMGAEDFSYYSEKVPACFIFLGTKNVEKGTVYMCHHPKFDIDEDAMIYGASIHAGLALNFK